MKLSIIIPVMNQHPLAQACIDVMMGNLSDNINDVEFVILDNGSDVPFIVPGSVTVRYEKSIGVYPTFWQGLIHAKGDILAFFHSDLAIYEKGWDDRVIKTFTENPKLGLLGFIGSNEIDSAGGRGLGTASNFMGDAVTCGILADQTPTHQHAISWTGSPAEVHGKRLTGFMNAAVVDGCAMIFRRTCLESISQRENFPPHHFYDRLLSCETKEKGYTVGVLGIECDHFSGQTVNQEPKYEVMAREWAEAHGRTSFAPYHNWDSVIYHEAEGQWLSEYRNMKCIVPFRVS